METAHSKIGGAKVAASKIVIASWDDVWNSFKRENTETSVEAMNSEGWKTVAQVAEETCLSSSRINGMVSEKKLESIKRKVSRGGVIREINFVRPKM
jgi:predicted DNA binding CopG/RHH family protein